MNGDEPEDDDCVCVCLSGELNGCEKDIRVRLQG